MIVYGSAPRGELLLMLLIPPDTASIVLMYGCQSKEETLPHRLLKTLRRVRISLSQSHTNSYSSVALRPANVLVETWKYLLQNPRKEHLNKS